MPDDFKNKGYDTSPLYKAAKTFNESLHELLKSIKKSATSKEIAELKHLQNLGVTFESKILPMFSKGKMPGLFQLNSLQNFLTKDIAKLTPKKEINTPLDYEVAELVATFMSSLQNKKLIEIAPFFNLDEFLKIKIPLSNMTMAEKLKEEGVDELLDPKKFETQLSEQYRILTTILQDYRSRTPQVTPVLSATSNATREADQKATAVKVQANQTALPANSDPINTLIDTISSQCDSIIDQGSGAHIQPSTELQQNLNQLRTRYNRSQLTEDESLKFKADIQKNLEDIETQSKNEPPSSPLSSLTSNIAQLVFKLFASLIKCLVASVFEQSMNRNRMFTPAETVPQDNAPSMSPRP